MTRTTTTEWESLIKATGLGYQALASLLDTDERSILRWVSGERKPRHPAMLRKALQLILLEQRGVITERLIDLHARPGESSSRFLKVG